MKIHPTALLQGLALACAMSILTTGPVNGQENARAPGTTLGNEIDDSVVTTRVKSALLADPGIKSFDIGVVTRKGEVQLSGYVDDRAQINRAIDVAQAVEGVQSVGNEMSVKK